MEQESKPPTGRKKIEKASHNYSSTLQNISNATAPLESQASMIL